MRKRELEIEYEKNKLIIEDKENKIFFLNRDLEGHREMINNYVDMINSKQKEIDFWIDENKKLRQECHELTSVILNLVKKGVLNSGNQ